MRNSAYHQKVRLIEERSAEFNRQTDRLNQAIENLEDRLQRAGVGFTVWTHWYLPPEDCPLIEESMDGTRGWTLGYDRMPDGSWRLALHEVAITASPRKIQPLDRVKPLRDSSRVARINGGAFLGSLLDCILERVEDGVRAATRAADLVRQLDAETGSRKD